MSQQKSWMNSDSAHGPFPSLKQLAPGATRWAFFMALGISLLFCAWLAGQWLVYNIVDTAFPVEDIAKSFGISFLIFFVVFFLARLLWLSRSLSDRVFAFTGFLATFFGLAMLVVFFVSLGIDTYRWLSITPKLVEARNEQLRDYIRNTDLKQEVEKAEKKELKKMEAALKNAKTEEKKNEVRKTYAEIIPFAKKQVEITVREMLESAKKSIREDTSTWGIVTHFLTSGPSSQDEPQNAGVYPAILGSLWIALITMLFAVPVGVGAALYLEEYRTKSWLGHVIQVNINNLAGIPSVVYGILGAFIFVELIFKPMEKLNSAIAARNVLGGGLTLGLLTLPIVIVSAQEAIRAVPKSIREGAYALGATQWQVIWRNVLPMSSPGILTGTILAISRAIGEAAPLVLFGALLFVNQEPGLFSRFTVMPMQIFGWASRPPEGGREIWQYNAAVASVFLMFILLGLNAVAIFFRNRSQKHMRY